MALYLLAGPWLQVAWCDERSNAVGYSEECAGGGAAEGERVQLCAAYRGLGATKHADSGVQCLPTSNAITTLSMALQTAETRML